MLIFPRAPILWLTGSLLCKEGTRYYCKKSHSQLQVGTEYEGVLRILYSEISGSHGDEYEHATFCDVSLFQTDYTALYPRRLPSINHKSILYK
jgi:hypothetical protein